MLDDHLRKEPALEKAENRPGTAQEPAPITIGILALQGSFHLHLRSLQRLGVAGRLVRKLGDLQGLSGLIVPGGESTVMSLLLNKYKLFEPLREMGHRGFPMFGTCAGAILLGHGEGLPGRLEIAPVKLVRNAYGTQIYSFTAPLELSPFKEPFHGVFIRAPKILPLDRARKPKSSGSRQSPPVEVLGWHGDLPVLVQCGSLLLATFHPELTDDLRLHEYFLEHCVGTSQPKPQAVCTVP